MAAYGLTEATEPVVVLQAPAGIWTVVAPNAVA